MKIGIGPYYYKKYGGTDGAQRMRNHGYEYLDFDWYMEFIRNFVL